jgi:hypothetical protein
MKRFGRVLTSRTLRLPVQYTVPPPSWSRQSSTIAPRLKTPRGSHTDPDKPFEARFKLSMEATESPEAYHPGGLHPVYLDDTLDDGRYKILRKLGFGTRSTAWLAEDIQ